MHDKVGRLKWGWYCNFSKIHFIEICAAVAEAAVRLDAESDDATPAAEPQLGDPDTASAEAADGAEEAARRVGAAVAAAAAGGHRGAEEAAAATG